MSLESSARQTQLQSDHPGKVKDHLAEAKLDAPVGAQVSAKEWADRVRESRAFFQHKQGNEQAQIGAQQTGSDRLGQRAHKLPDLQLVKAETDRKPDKKEVDERNKPKDANDRSDLFRDRNRIDKILKFEKVDGKEVPKEITLKPGEKLKEGTYEIRYKQTEGEKANKLAARAFRVHIPEGTKENAPVMVVAPGVSSTFQDPRGYVKEVHMEEVADKAKDKFIVVTPLTQKHKLSDKSSAAASAWNYPDSLIPNDLVKAHQKKVGYNDGDYMAGVADLTKDLTGATKDQSRWGWLGGSQGAAFINSLASNDKRFGDGKMRNIFLAGGSIPNDEHGGLKFVPQKGNGLRVAIIDTAGDTTVLPHPDKADKAAQSRARIVTRWAGIDAVDNVHQDPDKQIATYVRRGGADVPVLRRLGNSSEYKVTASIPHDHSAKLKTAKDFDVPLANQDAADKALKDKKDVMWNYTVKRPGETEPVRVTVFELPTAGHVIPGSRKGSTSLIGGKYEGLSSADAAALILMEENKRLSAKK